MRYLKNKSITFLLLISMALLLLTWGGCKREDGTATPPVPAPVLLSLSPTVTVAGTVNLLLTISGSNFSTASEIFFNGSAVTTTFSSDTELRCLLSSADTRLNIADGQVTVSIFVRDAESGDSNSLDFTILKGDDFRNPVKVSAADRAYRSDLAVNSSGDIFVNWGGLNGSGFRISKDNGNSWDDIFYYDQVQGGSKMIIDHNDNLNMVWFNQQREMFFSRSTDQGNSWQTPVKVSADSSDFFQPDIAVGHSGVIVVTCIKMGDNEDEKDDEIYSGRSVDSGKTWSNFEKFADGRRHHIHYSKDRNLYLVWDRNQPGSGWNIFFRKSVDKGISWDDETRLTDGNDPNMVSHTDGSLYLIHHGGSTGLTFTRSTDQGATWVKHIEIPVNPDYGIAHYPEIAIDDEAVLHVAWMGRSDIIDSSRDANIYYSRSINLGNHWTEPVNVSNQTGCFLYPGPKVAADSAGNVYVVWINGENEGEGSVYFVRNKK